ncbi:hypothetical protein Dda_4550 [Drechslerella dactyloides]|uniref:Uncharacterized protein n=1 Tax=Drechslerella dactyloides TaxID=74499 RepID=A0AAD6IZC6_DREDA|nr:hypothetical protein Dda_4550 [Drechslerella dactyloides]
MGREKCRPAVGEQHSGSGRRAGKANAQKSNPAGASSGSEGGEGLGGWMDGWMDGDIQETMRRREERRMDVWMEKR